MYNNKSFRVALVLSASFFLPGVLSAATLIVTSNANSGSGSLRQVIQNAAPGDEIRFDASVSGPINLSHEIEINNRISIFGPSDRRLVINGGKNNRVFYVDTSATVVMYNLTISGGNGCDCDIPKDQGNDNTNPKWDGGGINNKGDLTLIACTLSGNTTTVNHGGSGGAVSNAVGAKLKIINSTISGNSTKDGGKGGAIYNQGSLVLTNSTVANNQAPSSTGGIYNIGSASISNSIVAGNYSGSVANDLFSQGTINSNGHNFIGVGSTGNPSDKTFASTSSTLASLIGDLRDNGGPTYTHALPPGSPAIDMGKNENAINHLGAPLLNDQRGEGFNRVANEIVDIGAFESKAMLMSVNCSSGSGSLQEAVQNAPNGSTIETTEGCLGKTIEISGPIVVSGKNITINGAFGSDTSPGIDLSSTASTINLSSNVLTISAKDLSRVFAVSSDASLSLSNLRVSNGFSTENGAAISNQGALSLNRVIFQDNRVQASQDATRVGGAAIFNEGSLNIRNAAFVNNQVRSSFSNAAIAGGAVYHLRGSMNLTDVSFVGNSVRMDADASAGNVARAFGAAVYSLSNLNLDGVVLEDNSAIARSQSLRGAQAFGGALYLQVSEQDAIRLRQITMSRNLVQAEAIGASLDINQQALAEGGAVYNAASSFALRMSDARFTDNLAFAENLLQQRDAVARGAAISNHGILNADYSLLRRNEVRASSIARSFAEAAAIYIAENAVATMNNADFVENAARATSQSVSATQSIARGAAISSFGSMSLRAASFSQNRASADALAEVSNNIRPVAQAFGAAMYLAPSAMSVLHDSTLDNNLVSASVRNLGDAFAYGAAIANEGNLDLRQSTVAKNSAIASSVDNAIRQGGGAYNAVGGNFELRNSTFADNSAITGANFFNAGQMLVRNSAFAYPALGNNFSLAQTSSVNALSAFNFADDQSGAAFARVAADLKLNQLADNGGFTYTMLPKRESILVDGGDPAFLCQQNFDQRGIGFDRCSGIPTPGADGTGPLDVGAVELSQCLANSQCSANSECQNRVCYVTAADASLCTPDKAFTYSRDQDNDGVGDNSIQVSACAPPAGYVVATSISDNCPLKANPLQEDANNNGIGDVCEGGGCRTQASATGGFSGDSWMFLALFLLMFGLRFRKSLPVLPITMAFLVVPMLSAQNVRSPEAVAKLESLSEKKILINDSTGAASFVEMKKSGAGEVRALSATDAKQKAQGFLKSHGKAFGLSEQSELKLHKETLDDLGLRHINYKQTHKGVPVFGAELKLHFDRSGEVGAANGSIVPDIQLDITPSINAHDAGNIALHLVTSQKNMFALSVLTSELMIYRTGMAQGVPGINHLVWKIEIGNGSDVREFVFVDAHSGKIIDQLTGNYDALTRKIYDGEANFKNNTIYWQEGNSAPADAKAQQLINYSGEFYNFFKNTFGRDSYDGAGAPMLSIFNRTAGCPNASWNGTYVSVCDGLFTDDVIGHEWAHALIENTNGLVYAWQAGALNESYADIWGETIDLVNGLDKAGNENQSLRNQTCPCELDIDFKLSCAPDKSNRWLVGEDNIIDNLPLRDMFKPSCFKNPEQVADRFYQCNSSDFGGVHINSSVPNRAFALLSEGNAQVNGIGLVKAASIYWRAQSTYEGPFTNFKEHADALYRSCTDLIGETLVDFNNSAPGKITAEDCNRVKAVSDLVFFANKPCNTIPLLDANIPPPISCPRAIYNFSFFGGNQGFTTSADFSDPYSSENPKKDFDSSNLPGFQANQQWRRVTELPDHVPGAAFFAPNSREGSESPGKDASNVISLISPPLVLPNPNFGTLVLTFDHNMASEKDFDGGNVKISVDNGATWNLIGSDKFIFNAYNLRLIDANGNGDPLQKNSNPMAAQPAFSGADNGDLGGSWVQSQVNLTEYKGQTIKLKFDFGSDKASGVIGWYITNIRILNTDPSLSVKSVCGKDFCASEGLEFCDANGILKDSCQAKAPPVFYSDADGDGVGSSSQTVTQCVQPQGYVRGAALQDNCPTVANPDQRDSNNNGIGDACEQAVQPPKSGCDCNNSTTSISSLTGEWLVFALLALGLASMKRFRRKGET